MSNDNKMVVLINGSPKSVSSESVSEFLLNIQEDYMKTSKIEVYRVNARESLNIKKTQQDFEMMLQADAIIITFPLYIFCLPGVLIRFLQDFHQYQTKTKGFSKKVRVYTVVNCGFPEAYINEEAVRVIQSFSRQTGALFRFGVMIGSGGMIMGALDAPIMKKMKADLSGAFGRMAEDISSEGEEPLNPVFAEANFPAKLYYFMATREWYSTARNNKLKKKDLFRRPYLK